MTDKDEGVFRLRVRVKAGSQEIGTNATAPVSGSAQPKSLIEALKQTSKSSAAPKKSAKKKKAAATRRTKPESNGATDAPGRAQRKPAALSAKENPRDVIAAKPVAGAAARLKHLERLKEAAAGLEDLARGQIEEATVEIIHHDGSRPEEPPLATKSADKG